MTLPYVYMYMHTHAHTYIRAHVCTYTSAVVTSECSTTAVLQQDGGDVGASVIDHLPNGVSAQCKSDFM